MALIPRKRMSSDLLDPKPKKGSFNGVTSDGVFNATGEAIDNILDNGSASETIVVAVPSSQSSNYTIGNYYEVQGKVARLRTKTDGDNVTQLTFDTTSGLLDAMNEIIESIVSIGSPLQWKGPATVAELNAGINGIQPGWTYTLTDAGTLTDGSVTVDVGDEVAWTEDGEWFKFGGEGGVKILHGSSNPGGTTYPDAEDVINAVAQGKDVIILWNQQGNLFIYSLVYVFGYGSSGDKTYIFRCLRDQNEQKKLSVSDGVSTWSRATINSIALPNSVADLYSDASTYSVGDYCMFGGEMYKCTTAVTVAEPFDSTKWTHTNVAANLGKSELFLIKAVSIPGIGLQADKTFAEISAAIAAGMFVMLLKPGTYGEVQPYFLHSSTATELKFQTPFTYGPGPYYGYMDLYTTVNNNDQWSSDMEAGDCGALANVGDVQFDYVDPDPFSVVNNTFRKLILLDGQQALTLNVTIPDANHAPNFCIEIDNGNNTDDCVFTVTVTNQATSTTTTLKYSVAGGNTVGAGKYVQLTCVGSCWTLAEFTVPTP